MVWADEGIHQKVEHGTWELGDGVVSLGGYLGYKSISDNYNDGFYSYSWKWSYTIIGVRGAYHFPLDNDKLDIYLGAMLSYNILNFKYTNDSPSYNSAYDYSGGYGSAAGHHANFCTCWQLISGKIHRRLNVLHHEGKHGFGSRFQGDASLYIFGGVAQIHVGFDAVKGTGRNSQIALRCVTVRHRLNMAVEAKNLLQNDNRAFGSARRLRDVGR